jgi:dynein heavy chain 1
MKYVYLEGIFFGSADIKTMLANEFNRFKDVDNKFIALMKKVNGNPQVLQVCEIPDL